MNLWINIILLYFYIIKLILKFILEIYYLLLLLCILYSFIVYIFIIPQRYGTLLEGYLLVKNL